MKEYTFNISDLELGKCKLVKAGERELLLSRGQEGVFASDAVCPHQALSLAGARVRGRTLICPHHGARFRLGNGVCVTAQLTSAPLQFYPVAEDGDAVTVVLKE